MAALIAATIHDLDHPGRGNAFLMNTRQRLALLYNDHSVLENHHVALAFQLTLSQPGVNIFGRVPPAEFTNMRRAIIDMVLATDMSKHFEYLTKFQQLIVTMSVSSFKYLSFQRYLHFLRTLTTTEKQIHSLFVG
jgi:high affinity cAMP-specific and IBMX-insensitive 3',5'-cyclic phosphodiesterase 8